MRLDTIEMHGFSIAPGSAASFPRGGRHRFAGVMDGLSAPARPAAHTDYLTILREFIGTISQRGLVIIISDFLDDQGCESALQYLADFGHELMLLQIWADEDRTPPWTGELELRDAETGAGMKLDFDDDARQRYTARVRRVLLPVADDGSAQRRAVCGRRHVAIPRKRDLRRPGRVRGIA